MTLINIKRYQVAFIVWSKLFLGLVFLLLGIYLIHDALNGNVIFHTYRGTESYILIPIFGMGTIFYAFISKTVISISLSNTELCICYVSRLFMKNVINIPLKDLKTSRKREFEARRFKSTWSMTFFNKGQKVISISTKQLGMNKRNIELLNEKLIDYSSF